MRRRRDDLMAKEEKNNSLIIQVLHEKHRLEEKLEDLVKEIGNCQRIQSLMDKVQVLYFEEKNYQAAAKLLKKIDSEIAQL